MSISPLIPAAGAAGVFAARAAQSLAGGVSFADIFRKADAAQPSAATSEAPVELPSKSNPTLQTSDPRRLLADFQELLKRRLLAAGIDVSQPLELSVLNESGVKVSGDHPDWAKIEQIFDEDSALRDDFQKLADAYARENLGDRRRFQLALHGESAQVSFE
jgi:hypothetical protein